MTVFLLLTTSRAAKTRHRHATPSSPLSRARLAEGDAEKILRKQIEKANDGDQRAAEFILSRARPACRGRSVSIELPKIETGADIVKALGILVEAVAAGDISPEEGDSVTSILDAKRRPARRGACTMNLDSINRRLDRLDEYSGLSFVDELEHAQRAHSARQAA